MLHAATRRLHAAAARAGTAGELVRQVGAHALARRVDAAGFSVADVIAAARQEAIIAGHPYVGFEHVQAAACALVGDAGGLQAARQALSGQPGPSRRWWRPRGPRSALRRRAQAELARRQRARGIVTPQDR